MSIAWYLSSSQGIDANSVSLTVDSGEDAYLVNGDSYDYPSPDLTIPTDTQPGTYYLVAQADANSEIPQADTSNNIAASSAIQIGNDLPDLSPFQITGNFSLDSSSNKYVTTDPAQIGLVGMDPILQVANGSVSEDSSGATATGDFSVNIGGGWQPLFTGTLSLDVAAGRADLANSVISSLPSSFLPGGMKLQLSSIAFDQGGGVDLQGSLQLPSSLGGATLAVSDPNELVIDSSGVSLTGGSLQFPDQGFSLFGLSCMAQDMSLSYDSSSNTFTAQGKFSVPSFHNATLDLSGDNSLQISPSGVTVSGTLSADDIVIVPGEWELQNVSLSVSPNSISGSCTMLIPDGITVSGTVSVVNGQLNSVALSSTVPNIAIGTTGAFLQKIGGSVTHLSDGMPTTFGGELDITYGPKLSVTLPSFLGGKVSGSLLELDLQGAFNANDITGTGKLTLIGGLVTGTATADLSLQNGTFSMTSSLSALGGTISGNGTLNADSNLNLSGSGTGTLSIPNLLGGLIPNITLGSATIDLEYHNGAPLSSDYIEASGILSIPLLPTWSTGIRVNFDGTYQELGQDQIPKSTSAARRSTAKSVRPAATVTSSQKYIVPAGSAYILFAAFWQTPSSSVSLTVTTPAGKTYADTALPAGIALAPSLSSTTRKVLVVTNPQAGTWTIAVKNPTGLGTITYQGTITPAAKSIKVTSPATVVAGGGVVKVAYTGVDPAAKAAVSLFYDHTGKGDAGVPFATGLAIGSGSYSWNTASLAPGTYYVYASINDPGHAAIFSYATGDIVVAKPPFSATIAASLPKSASAGSMHTFSVIVTNTGTTAWSATGSSAVALAAYFATAGSSTATLPSTAVRVALPATLAAGASVVLTVNITAPTTAAAYTLRCQMVKGTSTASTLFGQLLQGTITIGTLGASYTATPPAHVSVANGPAATVESGFVSHLGMAPVATEITWPNS